MSIQPFYPSQILMIEEETCFLVQRFESFPIVGAELYILWQDKGLLILWFGWYTDYGDYYQYS